MGSIDLPDRFSGWSAKQSQTQAVLKRHIRPVVQQSWKQKASHSEAPDQRKQKEGRIQNKSIEWAVEGHFPMLTREIHDDELVVLNTYAADDTAAPTTRQKLQETQKETATTRAARDNSALSGRGGPNGQNVEPGGPENLINKTGSTESHRLRTLTIDYLFSFQMPIKC